MIKQIWALALIGLVLLAGCDTTPATPDPGQALTPTGNLNGELKIGAAAPFTGDTADGGIQIWQGAELAAAEWNAKSGLLGKRITIVAADDQASPTQAVQVATQLIADQVVAVIGHKDSGLSIPASAVYNKAGIVMVSPTSSNPQLTQQGFDTVFRVCPVDSTQGPFLADYLITKLQKKKIAVIYADTAYGQGLHDQFVQHAAELGVKPVTEQPIYEMWLKEHTFVTELAERGKGSIAEGHELASHGDAHSLLLFAGPATIALQFRAAEEAVSEAVGTSVAHLFRAPHGYRGPFLAPVAHRLGYRIVGWTGAIFDTARPGVDGGRARDDVAHRRVG